VDYITNMASSRVLLEYLRTTRLRGAGVPLETRKALLGHANGDITTHYSAAELGELLSAAGKIVDRGIAQSPTLTVVRRTADKAVGIVSESC
jgi:hypothetical protein